MPIENAFSGTYSWGGGPPTPHRGFTRTYPAARSAVQKITPPKQPAAPKAPDTPKHAGLNVWDIVENAHPVVYAWRHAEAIDATGLDPTQITSIMAWIKMQQGWSGDPDQQDQSIFLLAALLDSDSRASVWAGFIQHDSGAVGPHAVAERDSTGRVIQYKEFVPNPRNPSGWDVAKRFDLMGAPHFNKTTKQYVPTPHVHDPDTPGGVRVPEPWEVP